MKMKAGGFLEMVLLAGCLAAVPTVTSLGNPCDFSGLDIDDMVKTIVQRLPSHHTPSFRKEEEVFSGFFLGPTTYNNMDKLETFSPVVGFCRDGLKLVQVDLLNSKAPLHVVMPWKTCAGKNGTVEIYTRARVTVTLKVVDPTIVTNETLGESPMVHHGIPQPVFVEVVSLRLKGAGEVLGTVASVLGRLFQSIVREFGEEMVTYGLRDVLNEIGSS